MVDSDARQLLARLASRETAADTERGRPPSAASYRDRIDDAVAATADLDAATAYLATRDLGELEAAVERAEDDLSARAAEGRDALATLRAFREATSGDGQFRSGLRTSLGDADQAGPR